MATSATSLDPNDVKGKRKKTGERSKNKEKKLFSEKLSEKIKNEENYEWLPDSRGIIVKDRTLIEKHFVGITYASFRRIMYGLGFRTPRKKRRPLDGELEEGDDELEERDEDGVDGNDAIQLQTAKTGDFIDCWYHVEPNLFQVDDPHQVLRQLRFKRGSGTTKKRQETLAAYRHDCSDDAVGNNDEFVAEKSSVIHTNKATEGGSSSRTTIENLEMLKPAALGSVRTVESESPRATSLKIQQNSFADHAKDLPSPSLKRKCSPNLDEKEDGGCYVTASTGDPSHGEMTNVLDEMSLESDGWQEDGEGDDTSTVSPSVFFQPQLHEAGTRLWSKVTSLYEANYRRVLNQAAPLHFSSSQDKLRVATTTYAAFAEQLDLLRKISNCTDLAPTGPFETAWKDPKEKVTAAEGAHAIAARNSDNGHRSFNVHTFVVDEFNRNVPPKMKDPCADGNQRNEPSCHTRSDFSLHKDWMKKKLQLLLDVHHRHLVTEDEEDPEIGVTAVDALAEQLELLERISFGVFSQKTHFPTPGGYPEVSMVPNKEGQRKERRSFNSSRAEEDTYKKQSKILLEETLETNELSSQSRRAKTNVRYTNHVRYSTTESPTVQTASLEQSRTIIDMLAELLRSDSTSMQCVPLKMAMGILQRWFISCDHGSKTNLRRLKSVMKNASTAYYSLANSAARILAASHEICATYYHVGFSFSDWQKGKREAQTLLRNTINDLSELRRVAKRRNAFAMACGPNMLPPRNAFLDSFRRLSYLVHNLEPRAENFSHPRFPEHLVFAVERKCQYDVYLHDHLLSYSQKGDMADLEAEQVTDEDLSHSTDEEQLRATAGGTQEKAEVTEASVSFHTVAKVHGSFSSTSDSTVDTATTNTSKGSVVESSVMDHDSPPFLVLGNDNVGTPTFQDPALIDNLSSVGEEEAKKPNDAPSKGEFVQTCGVNVPQDGVFQPTKEEEEQLTAQLEEMIATATVGHNGNYPVFSSAFANDILEEGDDAEEREEEEADDDNELEEGIIETAADAFSSPTERQAAKVAKQSNQYADRQVCMKLHVAEESIDDSFSRKSDMTVNREEKQADCDEGELEKITAVSLPRKQWEAEKGKQKNNEFPSLSDGSAAREIIYGCCSHNSDVKLNNTATTTRTTTLSATGSSEMFHNAHRRVMPLGSGRQGVAAVHAITSQSVHTPTLQLRDPGQVNGISSVSQEAEQGVTEAEGEEFEVADTLAETESFAASKLSYIKHMAKTRRTQRQAVNNKQTKGTPTILSVLSRRMSNGEKMRNFVPPEVERRESNVLANRLHVTSSPPRANRIEETSHTSKVLVALHASNLPIGGRKNCNSFAVVSILSDGVNPEREVGRTEVVHAVSNPTWTQVFEVSYRMDEVTSFRVAVYSVSSTHTADKPRLLGETKFDVATVLTSPGSTKGSRLVESKGNRIVQKGMIFAHVQLKQQPLDTPIGQDPKTFCFALEASRLKILPRWSFLVAKKFSPFYEVARRQRNPDGSVTWRAIVRSKSLPDTTDPKWDAVSISLQRLCHNDCDQPLKVSVYSFKTNGRHRLIGAFEASVQELLQMALQRRQRHPSSTAVGAIPAFSFKLTNKGRYVGIVDVREACFSTVPPRAPESLRGMGKLRPEQQSLPQKTRPLANFGEPTVGVSNRRDQIQENELNRTGQGAFAPTLQAIPLPTEGALGIGRKCPPHSKPALRHHQDPHHSMGGPRFLTGGVELRLCFAIDFGASNGGPGQRDSLHFISTSNPPVWNDYERAMASIGGAISNCCKTQKYPLWGFGVNFEGKTRNCFQLGYTEGAVGIDGVLEAYRSFALQDDLEMSGGAAHLNEAINMAANRAMEAQWAAEKRRQDGSGSQVYTVLVVITGSPIDLNSSWKAVHDACDKPLSVVVVGVGESVDFKGLDSLSEIPAPRRVVQSMDFNKFREYEGDLTSETLNIISDHLRDYYRRNEAYDSVTITSRTLPCAQPRKGDGEDALGRSLSPIAGIGGVSKTASARDRRLGAPVGRDQNNFHDNGSATTDCTASVSTITGSMSAATSYTDALSATAGHVDSKPNPASSRGRALPGLGYDNIHRYVRCLANAGLDFPKSVDWRDKSCPIDRTLPRPHQLLTASRTKRPSPSELVLLQHKDLRHSANTPRFIDSLTGGVELRLSFAIDFGASNGRPGQPDSLHAIRESIPPVWNDYERSIIHIGGVISKYVKRNAFPLWGFGVNFEGMTRNCLQMGCTEEVKGIDGVLDAYRSFVLEEDLEMSDGAARLNEVINITANQAMEAQSAAEKRRQSGSGSGQAYTVLVVLTGSRIDSNTLCEAVQYACDKPLSVVVVGVGESADTKSLNFLSDMSTARDIVQTLDFTKHRKCESFDMETLLRKVSEQLADYYHRYHFSTVTSSSSPCKESCEEGDEVYERASSLPPFHREVKGVDITKWSQRNSAISQGRKLGSFVSRDDDNNSSSTTSYTESLSTTTGYTGATSHLSSTSHLAPRRRAYDYYQRDACASWYNQG